MGSSSLLSSSAAPGMVPSFPEPPPPAADRGRENNFAGVSLYLAHRIPSHRIASRPIAITAPSPSHPKDDRCFTRTAASIPPHAATKTKQNKEKQRTKETSDRQNQKTTTTTTTQAQVQSDTDVRLSFHRRHETTQASLHFRRSVCDKTSNGDAFSVLGAVALQSRLQRVARHTVTRCFEQVDALPHTTEKVKATE